MTHPRDNPNYSHLYRERQEAAEHGQTIGSAEARLEMLEALHGLRVTLAEVFAPVLRWWR